MQAERKIIVEKAADGVTMRREKDERERKMQRLESLVKEAVTLIRQLREEEKAA